MAMSHFQFEYFGRKILGNFGQPGFFYFGNLVVGRAIYILNEISGIFGFSAGFSISCHYSALLFSDFYV